MYTIDCGSYGDIISWTPNGQAFLIFDPIRFEKRVLPELFKEAKFSSFDRKVSDLQTMNIYLFFKRRGTMRTNSN